MLVQKRKHLYEFLDCIPELRVSSIGDLFLDIYCDTSIRTSETEDNIPIHDIDQIHYQIGGAGTIARICAGLQLKTSLFGVVGADKPGQIIKEITSSNQNIETHLFLSQERKTAVKTRFRKNLNVQFRADFESTSPISFEEARNAAKSAENVINDSDVILIADYGKGLHPIWNRKNPFWQTSGKSFVATDTRSIPEYFPKNLNLVKKNRCEWLETKSWLGTEINDENDVTIAHHLFREFGFTTLLITLDKDGMKAIDNRNNKVSCSSFARNIITEVSAGNCAFVLFSLAQSLKFPLELSITIASIGAACTLEKPGSEVPSLNDLYSFIENYS